MKKVIVLSMSLMALSMGTTLSPKQYQFEFPFIFEEFLNAPRKTLSHYMPSIGSNIEVKIDQKEQVCIVTASLAGYDKADITIEPNYRDNTVTIAATKKSSSEKKEEKKDDGDRYVVYTYASISSSSESFKRVVDLPEQANLKKAKARYKNGELVITMPLYDKKKVVDKQLISIDDE